MSMIHFLLLNNMHEVASHVLGFQTIPQPTGTNCLDPATGAAAKGGGGGGNIFLGALTKSLVSLFPGGGGFGVGGVPNPIAGGLSSILSKAGTILSWLMGPAESPSKWFHDIVQWLLATLFPNSLQTWFSGTISGAATQTACGKNYTPAFNIYGDLYDSTTGAAIIIAAAAAACRIIRAMLDARISGMVMVIDTVPRFFVAVVGSQMLGKDIMVAAVNGTMHFATGLMGTIMSAGGAASVFEDIVSVMISLLFVGVATVGVGAPVVTILLCLVVIPLIILILYAVCLMIVRTIMMGFCFAVGPLCIATLAFDHKNRLFAWWSKLFVGVLMLPMVLGASIAISIKLAQDVIVVPVIGPVMGGLTMCCGLWFGGKAVHQLTWEHFSHGGALGAITAITNTMMAGPTAAGGIAGKIGQSMIAGGGAAAAEGRGGRLANFGLRMQGLASEYGAAGRRSATARSGPGGPAAAP